jgi:hypothetical protein
MKNNGDRDFIHFLLFIALVIFGAMIYIIYAFFNQSKIGLD